MGGRTGPGRAAQPARSTTTTASTSTITTATTSPAPAGRGPVILAAGAVLWVPGRLKKSGRLGRPRIALIHRPKYDDWTLPKGKLDPGETMADAALREVWEETGFRCLLGPGCRPSTTRCRAVRRRSGTGRRCRRPAPSGPTARWTGWSGCRPEKHARGSRTTTTGCWSTPCWRCWGRSRCGRRGSVREETVEVISPRPCRDATVTT